MWKRTVAEKEIGVLYALFLLCSLIGWVFETLYYIAIGRGLLDRGFLSLPLCPVYGLACVLAYLCFGLPHRPRFFARSLKRASNAVSRLWHALFYIAGGALAAVLCELASGALMHGLFSVRLWDYSNLRVHFYGYVSLSFGLAFGILMLLFMRFAFPLLLRAVCAVRRRDLYAVLVTVSLFLLCDVSMNCTYAYVKGAHLSLF